MAASPSLIIGSVFRPCPRSSPRSRTRAASTSTARARRAPPSTTWTPTWIDLVAASWRTTVPEHATVISRTARRRGGGAVNRGNMQHHPEGPARSASARQQEIASALHAQAAAASPTCASSVTQEPTIGGRRGGDPVQFVIQTPDFAKLRERLPKFLERAAQEPALRTWTSNLKFTKPELTPRDRPRQGARPGRLGHRHRPDACSSASATAASVTSS